MMIQRRHHRRIRAVPIASLLPNILTVLGLCAGLSAVRFALLERFEMAVICLLLAMVFDGLDGRMARLLRSSSDFGAELDSLADIVNFGAAPALTLYLWSLQTLGGIGWVVTLLFVACCALRLARFNTDLHAADPVPMHRYFTGVPAPAACGLAMLPMLLSFEIGPGWAAGPALVGAHMLAIALLMISRVPTLSFKYFKIKPEYALPALFVVAVLAASLVSYTWWTLFVIGVAYFCSIPFTLFAASKMARARAAAQNEDKQIEINELECVDDSDH